MRNKRYCEEHTVAWQGSTRRHANTTQADQDLRALVLQQEPSCRDCGAPSTVAGHIIPHAYGGQYTRDNLKGQCSPCNVAQIHTDRVKFSK